MGTIDDAIRASREREEKATKGPYEPFDNHVMAPALDRKGERGNVLAEFFGCNPMHGDNCNDTEFYAQARTWEPRFRDALDVAVEALEQYRTDASTEHAEKVFAAMVLSKIGKILEGGEK